MAGRASARPMRPLAIVVVAAWFGAAPVRAGDVEHWIGQLGAPQFARREAAARHLGAAGVAAIAPLDRAIRGGDLEISSRGIDVLGQMLEGGDPPTAAAAESTLEELARVEGAAFARLASSAVAFHRLGRSTAARERLESLGAAIRERPAVEGRGLEVEIAAGWRGAPADLVLVAHLDRLAAVSIHGVPVDGEVIEALGRLHGIQRIDLFGTGAGEPEAAALVERLPDARIDVRRGGRLGVRSAALAGPCEIRTVEPGSAADQAGLRSGDVILTVDGVEVASFDELTQRLGECSPGEVLRLTVARRDGTADGEAERIDCEVRLDAW